ncbi:MAG: hypothetical protein O7F76_10070 [Planctomycetota bacterium]|nr:hypothetical protein [Planctomycetota bacterium]MCZ6817023.1 hypothetical protein [Planctomycetota bacterium]
MVNAEENWLDSFQQLIKHYVPDLDGSSPEINVACLVAIGIGIFMALRSAKCLRWMVTCFGLVAGAWLGIVLAKFVGTPKPITSAVAAVALSVVAYKTYKVWLVGGSVLALFLIAVGYQIGQGDLNRYLEDPKQAIRDGKIQLLTPEEQRMKIDPSRLELLEKLGDRVGEELKSLGPTRWILPVGAAIVGGFLAWKALNVFAVVWMGLLGAVMAVMGGATFLCAHWPDLRTPMTEKPLYIAGSMIGLWILGLIIQAKEARFPKAKPKDKAESAED